MSYSGRYAGYLYITCLKAHPSVGLDLMAEIHKGTRRLTPTFRRCGSHATEKGEDSEYRKPENLRGISQTRLRIRFDAEATEQIWREFHSYDQAQLFATAHAWRRPLCIDFELEKWRGLHKDASREHIQNAFRFIKWQESHANLSSSRLSQDHVPCPFTA